MGGSAGPMVPKVVPLCRCQCVAVGHCRVVVGHGDPTQWLLQAGSDIVWGYGGEGGGSKFGTRVVPKWSKGPKTKVVGNCLKRGDMWSVLVCTD